MAYEINDATDGMMLTGNGPSLFESLDAIGKTLCRRIEGLADMVATSRSARTEQCKPFTIFVNGAIKQEGWHGDYKLTGLSSQEQITCGQECAQELFEAVLANKPVDAAILIWRAEPELRRTLFADGLKIQIYARLAWERIHEAAS